MAITNNVFSRITGDFRQQWGIQFRFVFRVVVMFVIPFLCVAITVSLCNISGISRTKHNGPQTKANDDMRKEGDHLGNQIVSRNEEKRGQENSSKIQQEVKNEGYIDKTDGVEEKGLQMALQQELQGKPYGLTLDGKFSQANANHTEGSLRENNDSKSQNVVRSDQEEGGKLVAVFTSRPDSGNYQILF